MGNSFTSNHAGLLNCFLGRATTFDASEGVGCMGTDFSASNSSLAVEFPAIDVGIFRSAMALRKTSQPLGFLLSERIANWVTPLTLSLIHI